MSADYFFRFGQGQLKFHRSSSEIAVKPRESQLRALEIAPGSDAAGSTGERVGCLGRFDLVSAPPATVSTEGARRARGGAAGGRAVYYTSGDRVPFVPEGTITVRFAEGTGADEIDALIRQNGLAEVSRTSGGNYVLEVPSGAEDAVEVAARLQESPLVTISQPDMITATEWLDFMPADALLRRQWHLENLGEHDGRTRNYKAGADARVVAAWKRLSGLGDAGVIVGIIDDGFDLTHPDLEGKAIHPYDFIRGGTDVSPEPNLSDPEAGDWHGTPCAGVAVGRVAGGDAVGVAPGASLMPVRMQKGLSPHRVAKWFDHMTDNGALIVSCSWNAKAADYVLPEAISQAISRRAREGRNGKSCVIVFAAGNSNNDINDPPASRNGFAIHPDVLAVSACTSRDERSDYSCFGREVAVAAPSSDGIGGWPITTIDVTGEYVDAAGVTRHRGYEPGDYTHRFRGTSSSCPLVAGICALVLSASPELTAAEVRDIIRRTARRIGRPEDNLNGHSRHFGHGCVNAEAAVIEALRIRAAATLVA